MPAVRYELRFVLIFAACALAFELAFVTLIDQSTWFEGHLAFNARASAALLRALGFAAAGRGPSLELGATALDVRSGCDAVEPTGLFLIAVLLFPASWRQRLSGVLAGALLLQALNVLRVASLALVYPRSSRFFELLHLTIWPLVMILVALLAWVLWARRSGRCTGQRASG
jgi:exosortase H (IPTLxxWG-CTERM-specific)